MKTISCIMIVKDEERNIKACLDGLKWADEIIVVDSGSTDRTIEICKAAPKVKFFQRPWKGFGPQKNMALSLATSDWVFSIDADERVSPELASEIKRAVSEPAFDAYAVKRKNIYRGQWVRRSGWWPDEVLRLFRREKAKFTDRAVHEAVEFTGPTGALVNPLVHHSYNGARDFIRRVERYSTLGAHQKAGLRKSFCALNILARTTLAFLRSYILKKGFLEGRTGLLIAFSTAEVTFYKYMLLSEMNEGNGKKD